MIRPAIYVPYQSLLHSKINMTCLSSRSLTASKGFNAQIETTATESAYDIILRFEFKTSCHHAIKDNRMRSAMLSLKIQGPFKSDGSITRSSSILQHMTACNTINQYVTSIASKRLLFLQHKLPRHAHFKEYGQCKIKSKRGDNDMLVHCLSKAALSTGTGITQGG